MYLCYLDESGTPESSDLSTHFVLLGIAIPATYWHLMDAKINEIKTKYGLSGAEIHTGYLTRRYSEQEKIANFEALDATARRVAAGSDRDKNLIRITALGNPEQIKQIRKLYRHTNDYIHLTLKERQKLLEDLADEIASWGHARLFSEAIDKKKLAPNVDAFDRAFEQVVSRFHVFLTNREKRWRLQHARQDPGDLHWGLLIEDNNETRAKRLTELMRSFRIKGTAWWTGVDRIIETPLFVNSQLTGMVQMADLCAYATRRFFEHGETNLFDRIFPRFDRKGTKLVGICHYTGASPCVCKVCDAHGRISP